METSYGSSATLKSNDMINLHAYRHAVFVERLGWELPGAKGGLEMDQFDRPDTIHVLARNDAGELCGCARLLPTNRPYLLAGVFPELMRDEPMPCSGEVWEVSRFAAADLCVRAALGASLSAQFDQWVGREVLVACVKCAMEQGIKRFITVSPLGIERLLRRVGVHAHRAGPPMRIGGHALFACWIEIDKLTIDALGLDKLS